MGNPLDKAKKYSLNRTEVTILFYVTAWFSGVTFDIHGNKCSIASAHEPTLRQLCEEEWESGFDKAHDCLTERGLFKTEKRDENVYIAGRRCAWAPKGNCMTIIEDIFSQEEQLYPVVGSRRTYAAPNLP